ncbi:recombinase family protein [Clostridium botulinum]|uniref:Recombinase family protein n=1 Tax=Clostridium botulinum TaxID=1491 RepID=A0A6M0SLG6_CLOBO|nr:recombinase family protein [Clostridium botulinum]NFA42142.1 recombinase family protein [Clostridium botulinum]
MKKELIKVSCYCRVSTNKDEQEQSFEAQQKYFKEKLSKDNGYDLVEVYADRGLSGTDFSKREQFNKMLEDCGIIKKEVKARETEIRKQFISIDYVADADIKPKFTLIYVKDSSRFARNTEVNRIISRLRDKGVYVYFEDLNKSTENPSEKMLIDFMFSMNEQESISRSAKVRFGNMQSAKDGKVRSIKLYGYQYNKEENSLRIINDEAEIVKLIFKLRLEGNGGRAIATILNSKGIKNRKGNEWRPNTINSMLQNPTYCGKVVRNRWYSSRMYGKDIVKLNDTNEWIVEDSNKVDKIIDEETFTIIQDMIEKNRNKVGRPTGKYHGRSEFAGKIKCEKCGKYYVRNTDRGRVFYNCSTKKQSGLKKCNSRNIQEYEIENLINPYLEKDGYKNLTKKYIDILIEKEEEKKASLYRDACTDEINNIKEEVFKYKGKLSKLTDILLADDSESVRDVFNIKKKEINNKLKELDSELDKLTTTDKQKEELVEKMNLYIKALNEAYKKIPTQITREDFINNYLYEIRVSESGELNLLTYTHLGFEEIMNLMEKY